jgi:mannose-1-phosphate guanylyltransferase
MFLFGAARFLDELAAHAPDIAEVCARASATAVREKDFTRVDEAVFAACRSDSVDYAVMEKTRDAVMVPLDAGWNDVGSWAALHEVLPADSRGNVIRGDVLLEDADGCYVHADSRLVAALGLQDSITSDRRRGGGAQGQGAGREARRASRPQVAWNTSRMWRR